MLQKIQKKIKEFFEEKGQGVVEYALLLGFVAAVAVYMINKSDLDGQVQANMDNAKNTLTAVDALYDTNSSTGTG